MSELHPCFDSAYVVHIKSDGCVNHDPRLNCFVNSNSALMIDVDKTLSAPIIIHYQTNISVDVNIQKNTHIHLLEYFDGIARSSGSTTTSVTVADNAQAHFYQVSQVDTQSKVEHKRRACVQKNSYLSNHIFNLSLGVFAQSIDIKLEGESANTDFFLLDQLSQSAQTETLLKVLHQGKDSESRQLARTIYADQTQGKFLGKVIVDKDASKSSAQQHYKTLLLSDKAKASVLPQLEINNDDISASHGASIGELDHNMLFYLQSRGIDPILAKTLLVSAFSSEITDTISQKDIALFVKDKVKDSLKRSLGT
ncbi:MAG: SufD family Fe-S cluster assembly protein [Myxococcales bacterium]|nr:SufD family Fe-S cluster assembly protein [Myxococcales bacterium]USN50372.1 MAG: SufD family Fe-S cluster assembly protein [Myxococcales bacterium]